MVDAVGETTVEPLAPKLPTPVISTLSALTEFHCNVEASPRRIVAGEAVQVMKRLWAGDESSFAGSQYRLERPSGFLRADPAPPVIVGGFGPRMAAIAGRHADGFNTQAAHPQLAELARVARDAHRAAGRDPGRFQLTVFAGFREAYLEPGAAPRAALEKLGVERLILLVEPPFDPARLRDAGRLLGGRR